MGSSGGGGGGRSRRPWVYLRRAAAWGATAHLRATDSIAIRDMASAQGEGPGASSGARGEIAQRNTRRTRAEAMTSCCSRLLL